MKKRFLLSSLLLAACAGPAGDASHELAPSNIERAKLHQSRRALSLYPARRTQLSDHRCRPYDGGCVELTRPQPVLTLRDFKYRLARPPGGKPEIVVQLSERQRARLAEATRKIAPGSLAIVTRGGKVLHLAKLREPLDTDRVRLSFCGQDKYTRVVRHLAGR